MKTNKSKWKSEQPGMQEFKQASLRKAHIPNSTP